MKMLISQTELDSKGSRDLIPLECYQCQKTHYRTKNIVLRILNGNHYGTKKGCFCSHECMHKDHRKERRNCVCKQCGKNFERLPKNIGKNTFCNTSCSAKYYNKFKIIMNKCLNCDKEYHPYRGSLKMKYCSHDCQWDFNKKSIYKKIEDGNYEHNNSRQYKEYLIYKYGYKCVLCGWDKINPKSNKCTVQIDHIDGNSNNNNLLNLRLLCPNCHSLTPSYMALNNGNGRHYRRTRYSEGKSY